MLLWQIPSVVEKELRNKANETGLSLNKTIISLLEKALNINSANTFKRTKKRNVAEALNSWSQEEFEECYNALIRSAMKHVFKTADDNTYNQLMSFF